MTVSDSGERVLTQKTVTRETEDTVLTGLAASAGGKVAIYDLRRNVPLITKDHMYDAPIRDIKFHTAAGDHTGRQRVISADTHVIKVRPHTPLFECVYSHRNIHGHTVTYNVSYIATGAQGTLMAEVDSLRACLCGSVWTCKP